MPSLITHYEFSKQYIKTQQDLFYLASQGPDPFFYYGYTTPFKSNIKDVREFGTFLHEIDPYTYFSFLIEYANKKENEKDKDTLIPFIKGLLSHYILDRTCHPYIFYKTGFPLGKTIYSFYHSNFETTVDVLLEKEFKDHPSYKKILKCHRKDLKIVSKMMFELSKHFNKKSLNEKSYFSSVKTMLTVSRLINSKFFGFRKKLINKFLPTNTINAMSHPKYKDIDLSIDYLNSNKKERKDVVTNASRGSDTLYQLMDKARDDLLHGLNLFDRAFKEGIDENEFQDLFKGINHDGIKFNEEMHYFDLIYTKKATN